ncbi:DUF711 family protein [Acidilobus sp.]|uniref:DUF711 family protein n=1 Tax=Acidilobus sp. TaxID=1872109 RepID=UPI003CFC8826
MSFEVRAVTLHLGTVEGDEVAESIEDAVSRLLDAVDSAASELGVRPTYARVAIPGPGDAGLGGLAKELEHLTSQASISVGQLDLSVGQEDLKALASAGLYASLMLREPSWSEARAAASLIAGIASEDPVLATRVAVNVSGERHFITPYYPLASAVPGRVGVTAALTYPSYLASAYRSGGIKGMVKAIAEAHGRAESLAKAVASRLGAEYMGVDLSVSPWMEDSSLGLVEEVASVRMPKPGFVVGVRLVNEAIAEASRGLRTVGFNEVMLPVGEDSKLKARASEGDVNARYLAMLSGACVAGLDMVAVPADLQGVAGLILDVASYSRAKGRTLGVRLIPVDGAEPGDRVDLGRFGDAPVIAI